MSFERGVNRYLMTISEMPFGQVPVLEVDGKMFSESVAINNFLARKFGEYIVNKYTHAQGSVSETNQFVLRSVANVISSIFHRFVYTTFLTTPVV